jgi:hypothetical protein
MSLSRRSVLGNPAAGVRPPQNADPAAPSGTEAEPASPLDVPAFLRRQSEG